MALKGSQRLGNEKQTERSGKLKAPLALFFPEMGPFLSTLLFRHFFTQKTASLISYQSMALSTSKAVLRKEVLSKVASMSVEERSRQSDIIQKAVLESKAFKGARHISVYLSLPKEVSTTRIVDSMLAGTLI